MVCAEATKFNKTVLKVKGQGQMSSLYLTYRTK